MSLPRLANHPPPSLPVLCILCCRTPKKHYLLQCGAQHCRHTGYKAEDASAKFTVYRALYRKCPRRLGRQVWLSSSTKQVRPLIKWQGPGPACRMPSACTFTPTLNDTPMTDFGYEAAPVRLSSQLLMLAIFLWSVTPRQRKWLWKLASHIHQTVIDYQKCWQSTLWAVFHRAVRKLLG